MTRDPRTLAVVGVCALVAAGVAIGGAWLQGGDGETTPAAATQAAKGPPLDLDVLPAEPHAAALVAAERAYGRGDRETARKGFAAVLAADPGSLPAAVGAAFATWPEGTVARLRTLVDEHPGSALAKLHLGLALSAGGDANGARAEWRRAAKAEPDTRSAVQADSLLHPEMAPGLPFFVPGRPLPARLEGLDVVERLSALRARARHGGAHDWLALGAVYQQLGRPVSARQVFDRARALAPESLETRAAAAVGRFDKDDPSAAFSRLGPLARAHPNAAVVRFHLGVMLLWIRQVGEAKRQLTLARRAEPGSIWARQAGALLARLTES